MPIVFGIVLVVLGLMATTPAGAALSMRINRDHPHLNPGSYQPKTITGTRILGAVIAIAGIVVLATSI